MSFESIPPAILMVHIAPYVTIRDQLQLAKTQLLLARSVGTAEIQRNRKLQGILFHPVAVAPSSSNAPLAARAEDSTEDHQKVLSSSSSLEQPLSPQRTSFHSSPSSGSRSVDFHLGLIDNQLLRSIVSTVLFTSNELLSEVESGNCPTVGWDYHICVPDNHWLCTPADRFEWPQHCNLHFWRHGPGYRGAHYGEIQPNVDYCIFQPDMMVLTNGIWHTRELIEAMVQLTPKITESIELTPSAVSSSSSSTSASASASRCKPIDSSVLSIISDWSTWCEKWKSAIQIRASWESVGTDENYRSCGMGDAVDMPNTAARSNLPLNPATGATWTTYGVDASVKDFPPIKSVVEWSRKEKQYFLHAWQRLDRARRQLFGAGSLCRFHLYNNDFHLNFPSPPTERYGDALQPLAFLLPWPTDGGEGDMRYEMGGPPRWNSDQQGIITNSILASFTSSRVTDTQSKFSQSPIFNPAAAISSNFPHENSDFSVCGLSSIVRGCPWPLDCTDYSSNSIIEPLIVARRIVKMLGVSQQLAEPIHIYHQSYCAGPRPIGFDDPDRSMSSSSPEKIVCGIDGSPCPWPITRLFSHLYHTADSREGPALSLSTLLTSSFIFSFGSEHLVPWPAILVAPIAPGWIGGLIAAANSFE